MQNKGMLIIVSAPSGTGKGAIIKKLMEKDKNIKYSVSATTRKPRKGEVDGHNYFFLKREKFEIMIENNEFVEWDEYCENYYGTPKEYIDKTTMEGNDVILEITVAGAVNVKAMCPEAVMIFVLPPSMEELRKRITGRGTEDSWTIERRLEKAVSELKYVKDYEYVVINDDLSEAVNTIEGIIQAERHKYKRNTNVLDEICK